MEILKSKLGSIDAAPGQQILVTNEDVEVHLHATGYIYPLSRQAARALGHMLLEAASIADDEYKRLNR